MSNCPCPCPCPCPEPGYLAEPYHLPGYGGHIPTFRHRIGGTFGKLSRDSIEDPCTAQAPCPVLQPPMCRCPPGCEPPRYRCGTIGLNCDPRALPLNRSPYACVERCEPDSNVYRCCEPMSSSYSGHIPGFNFNSDGKTTGKATWGIKQYMNNCMYYNTFLQ